MNIFLLLYIFQITIHISLGKIEPPCNPPGSPVCKTVPVPPSPTGCDPLVKKTKCVDPTSICTKLENTYLYYHDRTTRNMPYTGVNYNVTEVHVCRPHDYKATIAEIKKKMSLNLGEECWVETESMLLKTDWADKYYLSLDKRLTSLEDIAWSNRTINKMCKVYEYAKCKKTPGSSSKTGTCECFDALSKDAGACTNGAGQFQDCGKRDLLDRIFTDSPLLDFSDPAFPQPFVYLPDDVITKSVEIECKQVGNPLQPGICDPGSNTCTCPQNTKKKGEDCEADWSPMLNFAENRQHLPNDLGPGSKFKEMEALNARLKDLELLMTKKDNAFDTCTISVEEKTDEVWKFLEDLNSYNKPTSVGGNPTSGIKSTKDFKLITDHLNQLLGLSTGMRLLLSRRQKGDYSTRPTDSDNTYCGLKRDSLGNVLFVNDPNKARDKLPVRLKCQTIKGVKLPNSPAKDINACLQEDYTVDDFQEKFDELRRISKFYENDAGPASDCETAASDTLMELLGERLKLNDLGTSAAEKLTYMESFHKFRYENQGKTFCDKKEYGMKCIENKCRCDDQGSNGNHIWAANDQGKMACLVRFGRLCQQCDPKMLSIYVPCKDSATQQAMMLPCEMNSECLPPYLSSNETRECLRVTGLPSTSKPKSGTERLVPKFTCLCCALVYYLLFL